jgi:hypothetical protein
MSSGDTATPDGFHALHAANSFYQFYLLVQRFLKFESYGWSFRGEIIGRRPMIENRNPGITVAGYWIPGSPASLRRPGMMGWTAPDGIISARLVVLIRASKGDRP